jgi:hypothetical protein
MIAAISIDGEEFKYPLEGNLDWNRDGREFDQKNDLIYKLPWGKNGYCVLDIFDNGQFEELRSKIGGWLSGAIVPLKGIVDFVNFENYHDYVDEFQHSEIIKMSRELSFESLGISGEELAAVVSEKTGLSLSHVVSRFGKDHIQLRINRPHSLDFNPPHRDSYLRFWENVINLWIPIAGCNENSSLPVIPGSHLWSEECIFRTDAHGAMIQGNTYRVPAIVDTKHGMNMKRVNPKYGQCIAFSPFLIHGAATNKNEKITRMALELRLEIKGQCYL